MKQNYTILKATIVFIICFISINLQAQDTIPGLSTQPLWFIPIYFEDATGQKDTIYMGYDANSTTWGGGYDSVYSVNDSVSSELGIFIRNINCRGYVSTISKNSNDISADATFCNTIFPFTIKWDASKLYTTLLDSTIFPSHGIDTPRIKLQVESAGGNVQPFYNNNYIIYLGDSIEANGYSNFKDSVLVGEELAGNSVDNYTYLIMQVVPYIVFPTLINDVILENNLYKINPNPINNYFTIKTEQKDIEKVKIVNLQGQVVKQVVNSFERIDVSNLNNGLYFLQIETHNQNFVYKIIKN